jgi:hypothetical protein
MFQNTQERHKNLTILQQLARIPEAIIEHNLVRFGLTVEGEKPIIKDGKQIGVEITVHASEVGLANLADLAQYEVQIQEKPIQSLTG